MRTYTLLALSGLAPQVVTETAWSLARQHHPPLVPERVEVVATGVGDAVGRALLLGEPAFDPLTGQPVPNVQDRWTPFCNEVFGQPVPIRFHTPRQAGQPLPDVTGVEADRQFADLCYRLVAEHTRPGAPPLVGSLAGGRKTMGAHLMAAFAVLARPQDRLVHVIVHPASAERDPFFFYPHPGSDARVHRIDVPFPRLRSVLEEGPLRKALHDSTDLRSLLDAVQPFLDAEQRPDSFSVTLRDGHALVAATFDDEELSTARLTPAEAATLLVVAEALDASNGRVRLNSLVDNANVEDQRTAVLYACARFSPLRPWTAAADASKAVSRLNRSLAASPLLARCLSVESDVTAEATFYRWAEPLPASLTVSSARKTTPWPFEHLRT